MNTYLGVDIGSISTKGVIIDEDNKVLASLYIPTEGDPIGASKKLVSELKKRLDCKYKIKKWHRAKKTGFNLSILDCKLIVNFFNRFF